MSRVDVCRMHKLSENVTNLFRYVDNPTIRPINQSIERQAREEARSDREGSSLHDMGVGCRILMTCFA